MVICPNCGDEMVQTGIKPRADRSSIASASDRCCPSCGYTE